MEDTSLSMRREKTNTHENLEKYLKITYEDNDINYNHQRCVKNRERERKNSNGQNKWEKG